MVMGAYKKSYQITLGKHGSIIEITDAIDPNHIWVVQDLVQQVLDDHQDFKIATLMLAPVKCIGYFGALTIKQINGETKTEIIGYFGHEPHFVNMDPDGTFKKPVKPYPGLKMLFTPRENACYVRPNAGGFSKAAKEELLVAMAAVPDPRPDSFAYTTDPGPRTLALRELISGIKKIMTLTAF